MVSQPVDPSAWIKFRLLMWKNFLQQWRHRVQTAVELLLPVATMTIVLVLRSQIEPTTVDTVRFTPVSPNTLNYSILILGTMMENSTRLSIAYSPESEVLENVVRNAIGKLFLENYRDIIDIVESMNITDILPPITELPNLPPALILQIINRLIRVVPYDTSEALKDIFIEEEEVRSVIAAVEFDDSLYGATELPEHMSYSLRFPDRPRVNYFFGSGGNTWRTNLLFPGFQLPGPRSSNPTGGNDPGYVTEMFIALQTYISTELISRMTGEDLSDFRIDLQRYPHPPYVSDFAVEALKFLLPMFVMMSFSYTAVNIVRAITVEKELQLKETMKIMGLPTWLHWTAWFCKQFICLLIATVLIMGILKINWFSTEDGFSEYSVFTNTPWTVLSFYLLLYLTCTIFFCFMLSGFFSKGSTAALFTGLIWFLSYVPAVLFVMDISMSTTFQVFSCFFINSAMAFGFILILSKESVGGMQWGDFFMTPESESSRFTFGHVVVMLAVNCVVYMLIALYLEQVLPGPFGTPKPWNFFLHRQFWFTGSAQISDVSNDIDDEHPDLIKEKDPMGYSVGVKISKLTKVYGVNKAVDNFTLNIYNDQITVLLGHNGAGKSTTISMLTGNLKPSGGSVRLAGYDMATQSRAARCHVGLCPQHNVLFSELTVHEHLEFFARLKGFRGEELYTEIDLLIKKLELQEKRDYQSKGLSGGQKRRLCVGMALSGGAKVVLLDEPTSGMDPASRRALWDLLQKEKKGRAMILTTHFMDEADILGDRVAIMAGGRLQCVGSPYFLKRHYGVGYTLVVVKAADFRADLCTALIASYIPCAAIKEDRGMEVTYNLSNEYSYTFENILNDLENNSSTINFKNYGLVATTLEDVFMSVGSDVKSNKDDEDSTENGLNDETIQNLAFDTSHDQLNSNTVKGFRLWMQQVHAIWFKLFLIWKRSWILLMLQILGPLVLMVSALGVLEYVVSLFETIEKRELTLQNGFTLTETLLNFDGITNTSLGALATAAYEAIFTSSNISTMAITVTDNAPLNEYYLNRTSNPSGMNMHRNRLLTGATFSDAAATAWFSNFGYHDVATSLAAVHAALLRALRPSASLVVNNYPLEVNYGDRTDISMMVQFYGTQVSSGIGSSVGIMSGVFIMVYIKERVSRAKLLQKASGISPITLWSSAAIFDWILFLIGSSMILISCVAFQVIGMSSATELGRLFACLMLFGAAMLPLVYLLSFSFNGAALGFVIVFFINVLFGNIGPQIVDALLSPGLDKENIAHILDMILQFFPLYSLVTAVRNLTRIRLQTWSCLQSCANYPSIVSCSLETMCGLTSNCCISENPYWDWEEPGVLRYIVSMIVSCVILWALLLALEYQLHQKIFRQEKIPPHLDESTVDNDVLDEKKHVDRLGTVSSDTSLVSKRISKYYGKHLAVDQISFSVGDKECFGLLGVNGAGKTTTFKMLMGDEQISSGDAWVAGHSVKREITSVHEHIGYCPQFDAVFGELTGRETLRLFAMLRGLRASVAAARAGALAQALGFTRHLDKRVDQYSGGNKRKLSTAVALMGRTRLVFVDEPTTGVDPAAKRQVWNAVRGAQRAGRGVVLTSHSMEECEALCSRLTIMVNGRFQCLGTPQHLKNKFSQGFTLSIKLRSDEDSSGTESAQAAVQDYVTRHFREPRLMEQHMGLLTYYVASDAWARMFAIMERAQRELPVEDYSVMQTTLEQVFLQFTKYQREENQS